MRWRIEALLSSSPGCLGPTPRLERLSTHGATTSRNESYCVSFLPLFLFQTRAHLKQREWLGEPKETPVSLVLSRLFLQREASRRTFHLSIGVFWMGSNVIYIGTRLIGSLVMFLEIPNRWSGICYILFLVHSTSIGIISLVIWFFYNLYHFLCNNWSLFINFYNTRYFSYNFKNKFYILIQYMKKFKCCFFSIERNRKSEFNNARSEQSCVFPLCNG